MRLALASTSFAGERHFSELFLCKQRRLVGVMQRAGVAGVAAKLVHCPGVKLAVLVPLDELEEAVAGLPGERAIFLWSPVDGAQRVGATAEREVFVAANEAVDLAPLDVDPAKVFDKIFRSFLKLLKRSLVPGFSFARV